MVICKQPQIGGEVPEHNDSTFLYTDPPSALGFWIPLEACTPANGALSFLPGSHKTVPLTKRFVRLPAGGTGMEQLPVPLDEIPTVDSSAYVLQECQPGWMLVCMYRMSCLTLSSAGDLVIIHGSVLHKSPRNTSDKTRFAYTFHMIESPPLAKYSERNWLQPTPDMPFSPVLDAPNPRHVAPVGA
jgi:phytanoyl-CoA hydroxylase